VIFIVAMTLALLAAMGLYGLTATSSNVQAAGHMRQAAQAQHASEFSMMAASETFTPGTSAALVRIMMDPARRSSSTSNANNKCRSIIKVTGTDDARAGEACLILTEEEMSCISGNQCHTGGTSTAVKVNPMLAAGTPYCSGATELCPFFNKDDPAQPGSGSLGPIPDQPFLRIEVTNPVDVPPPPGSGLNDQYTFTQLTASVYVDMKPAFNKPASTVMVARGRITVGPYYR
jgi:hypothetical protein